MYEHFNSHLHLIVSSSYTPDAAVHDAIMSFGHVINYNLLNMGRSKPDPQHVLLQLVRVELSSCTGCQIVES